MIDCSGHQRLQRLTVELLPVDELRQPDAGRNAARAAQQAHEQRLDEELHQDVLPAGADGLADADLARPLGHGDDHDVHDADAADHQRDAGDRAQEDRQHTGDLLSCLQLILLAGDAEVGLASDVRDVVSLAQEVGQLLLHGGDVLGVARLDGDVAHDLDAGAGSRVVELAEHRVQRHVDSRVRVVLAGAALCTPTPIT